MTTTHHMEPGEFGEGANLTDVFRDNTFSNAGDPITISKDGGRIYIANCYIERSEHLPPPILFRAGSGSVTMREWTLPERYADFKQRLARAMEARL